MGADDSAGIMPPGGPLPSSRVLLPSAGPRPAPACMCGASLPSCLLITSNHVSGQRTASQVMGGTMER